MLRLIFSLFLLNIVIPILSQATEKSGDLILVPQSGHTNEIRNISITSDNKYFLTTGLDETVILWTIDGKQIRALTGLDSGIRDAAISPNAKFTAIANASEIVLADVYGNLIKKIKSYSSSSTAIAFSKDSTFFIKVKADTFSKDFGMELYDVKGNLTNKIKGDEDLREILKIDSAKDGKTFITIGYDGKLKYWNTSGGLVKTVLAHSKGLNFARLTPDGSQVISGGEDKTIKLWDLNGNLVKEIYKAGLFSSEGSFKDLDFAPDGKYFVTTNGSKIILMGLDGKEIKKLDQFNAYGVRSLAFSNDGKTILVGYGDGNISMFDGKGNFIGKALKGSNAGIYGIAYNGTSILVNGQGVLSWDLESESIEKIEGAASITQISYTNDNKYIIMASRHYPTVYVYDAVTKKEIRKFSTKNNVHKFSISNDNNILTLELDSSYNSELNLWDIEGNLIKSVAKEEGVGNFNKADLSAISPDGNYVASAHYYSIKIRDISGKEIFRTSDVAQIFSIKFSEAGNYILLGQGDKAHVYDNRGKLLFNLQHEGAIDHITSSPDEKYFLTGSRDKSVKLWDTNGKNLKTFSGHLNAVTGIAFSKDGKYVISASKEGMIRFFNIKEGTLAAIILLTEYGTISLSPDGRFDYGDSRAMKFISYRKGGTNEMVSLDQVFQSYYIPDLFKKIISGTLTKPTSDINVALKKNLPELKLELAAEQKNGKIDLNVEACDKGGGLQNIGIYQNGNLILAESYINQLTQKGSCKAGTVTLDLTNGQNIFKVSAFNSANIKAESPARAFTYVSPESKKPQMHILMIAIDEYVSEGSRLKFAIKDAQDLKESLGKYGNGAYGKVNFYEVYNASAVKSGILNAFKNLRDKAKLDDTVVVFFSGHGFTVDGKFFYIPQNITNDSDIDANSEAEYNQKYKAWEIYVKQGSISSDEISQAITQIKANNKMLIVDSCYSGGSWLSKVNDAKVDQKIEAQKTDMVKKSNLTGIAMISAAQDFQKANENGDIGHGFLTFGLLEAMKIEKDRGKITAFSVIPQASKKVRELSMQYKKKQIPFQSTSGVDFDLSD